jgi:hypothetical protein
MTATNCFFNEVEIIYKVHFEITHFHGPAMAKIKYIYNINAPSEFTNEYTDRNMFSGDEFNLRVHFHNID